MWILGLIMYTMIGIAVLLILTLLLAIYVASAGSLDNIRRDLIKYNSDAPIAKGLGIVINLMMWPIIKTHYVWCRYALGLSLDKIEKPNVKHF